MILNFEYIKEEIVDMNYLKIKEVIKIMKQKKNQFWQEITKFV